MLVMWAALSAGLLQVAETGSGIPGWVWIIPGVFIIFLLYGIGVRSEGKGVVKPEKDLASAASEPKSQPRSAGSDISSKPRR